MNDKRLDNRTEGFEEVNAFDLMISLKPLNLSI